MYHCSICGQSGNSRSEFEGCGTHYYHIRCLEIANYLDFMVKCEECENKVLPKLGLLKCKRCKSQILQTQYPCFDFIGTCVGCYRKSHDDTHVFNCFKCKLYLDLTTRRMCNGCNVDHNISDLCKIPKCSKHSYCKRCLNQSIPVRRQSKDCLECDGFFQVNQTKRNKNQCNLCNLGTNTPDLIEIPKCNSHKYCDECYQFILSNDSSMFPNISTCKKCKKSINMITGEKFLQKQGENSKSIYEESLKKATARYIKCENGHGYASDMSGDQLISRIDKNCRSCINKLIILDNVSKCILCGNPNDIPYPMRCRTYKNLCSNCSFPLIEITHVRLCEVCLTNLKDKINTCCSCNKFYEKTALYHLPKCNSHVFCKDCLALPLSNCSSYCTRCSGYFDRNHELGLELSRGKFDNKSCNLCRDPSAIFPGYCGRHGYCEICSDFILRNDWTEFPSIQSCGDCKRSIRSNEMRSGLEGRIGEKEVVHYKPPLDPWNLIHPNPASISYNNSQSIPPQTVLYQELIPRNNYPASLNSFSNEYNNTAIYSYPEGSKDRGFSSKTNAPVVQSVTDYELERLQEDNAKMLAELSLVPVCSICKNTQVYCSLECYHNCCAECLVFACCARIYRFVCEYSSDRSAINQRFSYVCPFEICNKVISVPTDMIIQIVRRLLQQPEGIFNKKKYNECREVLEYIAQTDLQRWVPYFDGIKPFIVVRHLSS